MLPGSLPLIRQKLGKKRGKEEVGEKSEGKEIRKKKEVPKRGIYPKMSLVRIV